MLLENKTAVIYGAGGAIGGAVARAYASEGAKVFVTGRLQAPVEALDLGTRYEVAAAAIRGLTRRLTTGEGSVVHMSLARAPRRS
jgi:NAD(P)-dependent dehydrogenase (short-subunit alcohol dehydrogenase family)